MINRFLTGVILVFVAVFSYTGARAQSETFEAEHYYRYMPARKAQAQPGKIAVTEAASDYSYQTNIFDRLPFEFSLAAKYIGLDDTVPVSLPAQLTELAVGLEATVPVFNFKNTYFRMSVSPSFLGDSWNLKVRISVFPRAMSSSGSRITSGPGFAALHIALISQANTFP